MFNLFTEVLLSFRTENTEMSFANSFTVDTKSLDRSLMQIKEKWMKRMELSGTPALTGNHSDVWPFSRTLWNLLLKKLLVKLNREFETQLTWAWILAFAARFFEKTHYEVSREE